MKVAQMLWGNAGKHVNQGTKANVASKTTMVVKATKLPTQPLFPHTDTYVSRKACRFSVKCELLLFDFNPNWNVSTNFNKTAQYKIL